MKKKWLPYFVCAVLILCIAAMIVWTYEFSETHTVQEWMSVLSDAFVVPGVLFSGFGLLSFFSTKGAYDAFSYTFSRFSLHSLFPTKQLRKDPDSFYDYKQQKDKKGRRWFPHILYTGLVSLGIGVLFAVLYAVM